MTKFERFIGIDYSGAGEVDETCSGLAVFEAEPTGNPRRVENAIHPRRTNWSRRELAEWLVDTLRKPPVSLVGLDHAFAPPPGDDGEGRDWDEILQTRTERWRTHERSVDTAKSDWEQEAKRVGGSAYRLTEQWTSSAKSVWDGRPNGVLHSTVAGIPWLYAMRRDLRESVHFWPFDGLTPPAGRSVIVEVYPALFWRRYKEEIEAAGIAKRPHQRDAWAVARWMQDMSARGALDSYLSPPLTAKEEEQAKVEGWILGVA